MAGEKLNLNALFVPFVVRCSSRVVFVFLLLLLGLGCLLKQGLDDVAWKTIKGLISD
jgi:hypothetical protein